MATLQTYQENSQDRREESVHLQPDTFALDSVKNDRPGTHSTRPEGEEQGNLTLWGNQEFLVVAAVVLKMVVGWLFG